MSIDPDIEPVAYLNGKFIPFSEANLSVADTGVVQGVTLTETLRTFGGRLFFVQQHLERLERGAASLGFPLRERGPAIAEVIDDLVGRNQHLNWPDTAVVVVATPGLHPVQGLGQDVGPTLCLHVRPVPPVSYAALYQQGWSLRTVVGIHAPPEAFPRDVKHRSRLNWYLAQKRHGDSSEPLFVDPDGTVTETGSGNILLVRGDRLILAPEDRVLPGVTQAVIADLAPALGYGVEKRPFTVGDLHEADETLISSSNYVLGPIVSVDGVATSPEAKPGPVFRRFRESLRETVGFDYVAQAFRLAAAVEHPTAGQ